MGVPKAGPMTTSLPRPEAARLCTVCTLPQTSTQRRHLTHLLGLRTMTLLSSMGRVLCFCSKGSWSTSYSLARRWRSQNPSFTQSHRKHHSQNFGSRSLQRELPMRRQWWQSTLWSESSSCRVSFLDFRTASVLVRTTMPSLTFAAQACWNVRAPSTSTTHMRQEAWGSSFSIKHRVGM